MNKTLSIVSLRVLMLVLVGLLGLSALLFAARDLDQSRTISRDVALLALQNSIADRSLHAIQDFAFERGRSNVVLRGDGPITPENRQMIDRRRASADEHIAAVLNHLSGELMGTRSEELLRTWARVKWLRPELEKDFLRARPDRAPTLPMQWMDAANALIEALESVMIDLAQASSRIDPRFDRINVLRIQAMQLRNLLGSEATAIGSELSAHQEVKADIIATVNYLRGRSAQVWVQLEPGVKQLSDVEAQSALEALREQLFNRLRPMQNEVLRAAALNQHPNLELSDYLKVSMATLNTTVELGDLINRSAERYTNERLELAQRQQMITIIRILAILFLAGLVALALFMRLTRPLNAILEQINALLGNQRLNHRRGFLRVTGDEFGRIRQALDLLEKVMAERLRQKAALDESERINASILACTPQSIVATGNDGLITVFSPGAEKMLGYSAAEMVGKQTPQVFLDPQQLRVRAEALSTESGHAVEPDCNVLVARTKAAAGGATPAAPACTAPISDEREWTYIRKDGTRITVLCEATQMFGAQGEVEGCLIVASDITERFLATVEMERMAHYDPLTGLPNRRLLHDRMQMAITLARREKSRLGLMLIDLDQFKPVNDDLGHAVGDSLLTAVSQRMQGCLRESDTLARIGGDEFVVLLPGIVQDQDALVVAEKIRVALCEPFDLASGHTVVIACSIGLAISPEHGADEKSLMNNADEAMYAAKELGRNRVQLFNGTAAKAVNRKKAKGGFPVMRLVWHESYLCGEALIDTEHQEFFDLANKLIHSVVEDEEDVVDLYDALDDLIRCSEIHFANEEKILSTYGYPDLEEHALKHQNLIARALGLRRKAMAGELTLGALVTFVVQDVVVRHMLNEDRKFFPLLKAALMAETPASTIDLPQVSNAG